MFGSIVTGPAPARSARPIDIESMRCCHRDDRSTTTSVGTEPQSRTLCVGMEMGVRRRARSFSSSSRATGVAAVDRKRWTKEGHGRRQPATEDTSTTSLTPTTRHKSTGEGLLGHARQTRLKSCNHSRVSLNIRISKNHQPREAEKALSLSALTRTAPARAHRRTPGVRPSSNSSFNHSNKSYDRREGAY